MTATTGRAHRGRSRDGLLGLAGIAGALVLVAVGTLLFREASGSAATTALPRSEPVAATAPVPTTATPTTAAPTTTTTTLPPVPAVLPQPERVPAEPYADVPVVAIGEIEIPKIGLVTPVYEGVWLTVIDVGPGHWPGTAEPGGWGNSVFGGHRSTYTEPFRHIDQLVAGDQIVVRTAAGAYTYAVTGSEIVDDSAMHIIDQAPGRTITLFACHPVGGTAQRYVVRGTLVT